MHSDSQVRSRMAERQAGRRDDGSPERPPQPANLTMASKARRFHVGIMILPLRPPTDWRRRLCGIRKRKRRCRQGYEAATPAAACERIFSVLYAPYRTCLRKYVRCGKIKLESQHPYAAYSTKEAGAHVLAGHRNQAVCV